MKVNLGELLKLLLTLFKALFSDSKDELEANEKAGEIASKQGHFVERILDAGPVDGDEILDEHQRMLLAQCDFHRQASRYHDSRRELFLKMWEYSQVQTPDQITGDEKKHLEELYETSRERGVMFNSTREQALRKLKEYQGMVF